MLRKLLVVGMCTLFFSAVVPAVASECECKKITQKGEGFCNTCNKGQIFGEKLTSRKVYETLHGVSIDTAKITCDGCQRANEKNGRCPRCKIGFVNGQMYPSPMAHAIALGTPYSAKKASGCSGCKKAFASNGFCSRCDAGFHKGRIYSSRVQHTNAVNASKIIVLAIAMSDDRECCSFAILTNNKCPKCNIRYQNGRSMSKKSPDMPPPHKGDHDHDSKDKKKGHDHD